jgi:hypothetical protein
MLQELIRKAEKVQDEAFFAGDFVSFMWAAEDIVAYESVMKCA